jgi:hypothetical protein
VPAIGPCHSCDCSRWLHEFCNLKVRTLGGSCFLIRRLVLLFVWKTLRRVDDAAVPAFDRSAAFFALDRVFIAHHDVVRRYAIARPATTFVNSRCHLPSHSVSGRIDPRPVLWSRCHAQTLAHSAAIRGIRPVDWRSREMVGVLRVHCAEDYRNLVRRPHSAVRENLAPHLERLGAPAGTLAILVTRLTITNDIPHALPVMHGRHWRRPKDFTFHVNRYSVSDASFGPAGQARSRSHVSIGT